VIKHEIVSFSFVGLGGRSDGWMLEHGFDYQPQERCAKKRNRSFRGQLLTGRPSWWMDECSPGEPIPASSGDIGPPRAGSYSSKNVDLQNRQGRSASTVDRPFPNRLHKGWFGLFSLRILIR
jgi:hypothetical protein